MAENYSADCRLSYREFEQAIQEEILQYLDAGIYLKVYPVLKNNSLHLDGLIFGQDGHWISPYFYLQMYYSRYCDGEETEELAQEILERWRQTAWNQEMFPIEISYERCKNHIIYRLISLERNRELLEDIPYIPFLDLAVTFHYLVRKEEQGIGTVRVTNQLIEEWAIDHRKLMKLSMENTIQLFPCRVRSLSSVIDTLLEEPGEKQGWEDNLDWSACNPQEPLVLTNESGINGAGVLLYPKMLERIGDFLEDDFYLLPSSIHEIIVIKKTGSGDCGELEQIVSEVNSTCVEQDEILSDRIYRYSRKEKRMKIVGQNREI